MGVKVIFLDVDGVLNHNETDGKFEDDCVKALKDIVHRTGAKIVLSSTWRYTIENTNAVLNTLRNAGVMEEEEEFLGHTAHLGQLMDFPYYPVCDSHVSRTDEILLWLKLNTVPSSYSREDFMDESSESRYQPLPSEAKTTAELYEKGEAWSRTGNWILDQPIELDQFIVLDDLPMLDEGCYGKCLKGHFIHTNLRTGLTMEMADDAVKIFSSKFNFRKWRKSVYKSCSNPNCLLKKKENEDGEDNADNGSSSKLGRPGSCAIA